MMYNDALKVLGIPSNFSETDLKNAYRSLSKRYHPDIAGVESTEMFHKISEAYDTLSKSTVRGTAMLFTHETILNVVKRQ